VTTTRSDGGASNDAWPRCEATPRANSHPDRERRDIRERRIIQGRQGMGQAWKLMTVACVGVGATVALWMGQRNVRVDDRAMSGELKVYEPDARALILRTDDGERQFMVDVGTPVHEGPRKLEIAGLRSAAGCRVKVWYRDAAGKRMASDIRISCGGSLSNPPSPPP